MITNNKVGVNRVKPPIVIQSSPDIPKLMPTISARPITLTARPLSFVSLALRVMARTSVASS